MKFIKAYASRTLAIFLLPSQFCLVSARDLGTSILTTFVAWPPQRNDWRDDTNFDKRAEVFICGFQDGDPDRMRVAASGYVCRIDTVNGLWGLCPATVTAATDCSFVGGCVDRASCLGGCGKTDDPQLTATTWYVSSSHRQL